MKQIDEFDRTVGPTEKQASFARIKLDEFPSSVANIHGRIRAKVAADKQRRLDAQEARLLAFQQAYASRHGESELAEQETPSEDSCPQ